MPWFAIIVGNAEPLGKAVQEIDQTSGRRNLKGSSGWVPPFGGAARARIPVHAQPEFFAAGPGAMGRGERLENRDSVNRSRRHDPLVRPTVVLRLLFEDSPDHHDEFG